MSDTIEQRLRNVRYALGRVSLLEQGDTKLTSIGLEHSVNDVWSYPTTKTVYYDLLHIYNRDYLLK